MTYEEWCENSEVILKEAEEYNKWRCETRKRFFEEIAPHIANMGQSGFHYVIEQQFANLILKLATPWYPCANSRERVEEEMISNMMTKIIVEDLLEQIGLK
jgi:hypothetical protein